MWNIKCTIIPVLTGATGIATEVLKKYLEVITGKYSVDSLQKTATRRTAIKKKKKIKKLQKTQMCYSYFWNVIIRSNCKLSTSMAEEGGCNEKLRWTIHSPGCKFHCCQAKHINPQSSTLFIH
jgi:hypothetical protein